MQDAIFGPGSPASPQNGMLPHEEDRLRVLHDRDDPLRRLDFSAIFVVGGGLSAATPFFDSLNSTPYLILFTTFLMGFVLDQISMILFLIPLSIPLIKAAGFDPIWFSVLFLMTIQTSYLTPPMAPAIFFLRGIDPPDITLAQMYRGVLPFICVQIAVIALLIAVPSLVWVW